MIGSLPARTDVAIIGAGFAGLATAHALARRGVTAIVLEREPALGRHASGRGAGLGRQLAEDDATSALTCRGAALLRARYPALWAPVGGILGFDDAARAEAYLARARRLDVVHAPLDRAGVLAHWPQLAGLPLAAALHAPGDGIIDVPGLLAALADGVALATSTAVTQLAPGVLDTAHGRVAARVIVDASGAWAGALTGDAALETFKRHLFVVEHVAGDATPFFWHLGACELYLRRHGDGLLVSPCDADVTPPQGQEPEPDADRRLHARLAMAAPGWQPVVGRRWACQRAFAPDRRMRLGRDATRPWLVWAAALGGHGATASLAIGETVADAVIEALDQSSAL